MAQMQANNSFFFEDELPANEIDNVSVIVGKMDTSIKDLHDDEEDFRIGYHPGQIALNEAFDFHNDDDDEDVSIAF